MSSKPRFVGEKICLNQVIRSLPASKAVIKKKAATEYADGLYPAFSASGQDVWLPDYRYNCHGVVVSAVGARCGKAFKASGKWNVVANTHPLALDEERIDWDYAWRLLNNENWWIKSGSGQPFVKVRESLKRSIHLPPLSIQKQFAANLRGVESQISIAQRSLAALDSLVKSRFVEMFESKDYGMRPMGDLVESITAGTNVGGQQRPLGEGEYGVLKISAVTQGVFNPGEFKVVNDVSHIKMIHPRKGDLLFSRANTSEMVGATAIVDKDYGDLFLPDKLWRLDPMDEVETVFLKALLSSPSIRAEMSKVSTGSSGSMQNISMAKFRKLPAFLPPLALQQEFAAFVSRVDKSRFIAQQQIEKLQMLYDSLAQDYFGD